MHSDIRWSIDPDGNAAIPKVDDRYDDIIANQNLLVFLPCKYQH